MVGGSGLGESGFQFALASSAYGMVKDVTLPKVHIGLFALLVLVNWPGASSANRRCMYFEKSGVHDISFLRAG